MSLGDEQRFNIPANTRNNLKQLHFNGVVTNTHKDDYWKGIFGQPISLPKSVKQVRISIVFQTATADDCGDAARERIIPFTIQSKTRYTPKERKQQRQLILTRSGCRHEFYNEEYDMLDVEGQIPVLPKIHSMECIKSIIISLDSTHRNGFDHIFYAAQPKSDTPLLQCHEVILKIACFSLIDLDIQILEQLFIKLKTLYEMIIIKIQWVVLLSFNDLKDKWLLVNKKTIETIERKFPQKSNIL